MKTKITIFIFLITTGFSWGQKVKYSKEEIRTLNEYYFNEGFVRPAKKKISTIILKDGREIKGNIQGVRGKQSQINRIILSEEGTEEKIDLDIEQIKEAYLFGSGFDKAMKVDHQISQAGTSKRNNMRKATTNDEIYFVNKTVSLKNKKDEQELLLQLLNPDFDDYISVYFDPISRESQGIGVGNVNFGGGVLFSYYVEKDGEIFWLRKKDFEKQYSKLFGDSPEFLKKYPAKSVNWDWFSGLVLEYTKIRAKA